MATKRNTNITEVLFPVEQQPVYAISGMLKPVRFNNSSLNEIKYVEIPNFSAIVDIERRHVFAVVSENYRLFTNQQAIELGEQCFRSVFTSTIAVEMTVYNITMPKTRSFCHIDYVHPKGGFDPWKDDTWTPFLRVTNSYNRMKPLSFDLGFCRGICTNGVIFGKKSITFRYLHTFGDIPRTVTFETSFGDLKSFEAQFIEKLRNLKRYFVPPEFMLPIACRVFSIHVEDNLPKKSKRYETLAIFRDQVAALTDKYFKELGTNGYAALNVITEIASRPMHTISPAAMVDQFQKRSGDWADDFIGNVQNANFDFEEYLGDALRVSGILRDVA